LFPPQHPAPPGEPLLRVQGLTVPGWAREVSFEVRPGEILGFAGLVGAGRTELFEGLLGLRPVSAGEVTMLGQPVRFRNPREAARHGLTYLSEDRKGKGLHVAFPLYQNLTLMDLSRHARPLLDAASEQAALKKAVADFGIRGNPQSRASSLSGGNQQKLAIAKVLQPGPRVVVLDEPTRGVDVGAKREIYFLIQRLADEGLAVIVISSELMELIGLCHRVAVMRAGALQATLASDHLTEEELIAHATGTH
jgi:ribose transport system ATP-binding protein